MFAVRSQCEISSEEEAITEDCTGETQKGEERQTGWHLDIICFHSVSYVFFQARVEASKAADIAALQDISREMIRKRILRSMNTAKLTVCLMQKLATSLGMDAMPKQIKRDKLIALLREKLRSGTYSCGDENTDDTDKSEEHSGGEVGSTSSESGGSTSSEESEESSGTRSSSPPRKRHRGHSS